MILVLDNIRSTYNVGSLFRTADSVGVSEILICGVTPDPVDRFGRNRSDIAKVALGAERKVLWSHFKTTIEAVEYLKEKGILVIALEQSDKSEKYTDVGDNVSFEDSALIVGEETKGLNEEVLSVVDHIAEIPMSGTKESLNVSVAAGVALFCFRDKKS